MSTEVTLPALGESVTEGTVSRWLKSVGDSVAADEPLLEVSTDKVDTEIPSPAEGTLLEIRADEDETVEVGAVLAVIGDASEGGADSGGDSGSSDSGSSDSDSSDTDSSDSGSSDRDGSEQTQQADSDEETTEETSAADEGREPDRPSTSSSGGSGSSDSGSGGGSGTEIKLPELGESVTEGTVSRWLKAVGDSVEVDEALLEVSTDKVDTEIPSPVAGTLQEIRVQEDETVEVGAVLAVVGDAGAEPQSEPEPEPDAKSEPEPEREPEPEPEAKSEPKPEPEPEPESAAKSDVSQQAQPAPAAAPRAQSGGAGADSYVTPLVRKLAAEHDVDLSSIEGTGVGGRIRKQDVLAAAEAAEEAKRAEETKQAAPAASAAQAQPATRPAAAAAEPSSLRGTTEKMSRLRKTIARRMVESLQVSAQLTATVEVDLTAISRIRALAKDDFKAREGASLSYLPFITKATVEALKVYPKVNATVEEDSISYPDAEHIGIAVDTPKGLLVPVIKDAGDLNIGGLAKKIADLAARTRSNKIGPDELGGGTFTITNYGSAGTLMDTPIINQPQVAILGTGALVKRPMVLKDPKLGEVIAVRDMMYLSMSYDHRVVDGADAARFLSTVKQRLEEGDFGSEFGL